MSQQTRFSAADRGTDLAMIDMAAFDPIAVV